MPVLSSIFLYPIKSLRGIQVDQWDIIETGLKYDRQWMLIDQQQNFLSQRRLPKMALISTQIKEPYLIVSAPNQNDLILVLSPPNTQRLTINIWHDQYPVQTVSPEADQWFSDFLQSPCQLVYQSENNIRQVDPHYANPTDQTKFSDGFPFLITTEASLALLNQQMGLSFSMQRFRPNLVISDCKSYEEDTWRQLSINAIHFRLPKPCSRCSIPQIDPETAQSGKEPLRTLALTRKWGNQVFFGQNALHDKKGQIQTGNPVHIIKTGEVQPPL